ncbi:MAG: glycoside hydrolase family 44 protein, partial [Pseudomonadota bacterium]
MRLDGTVLLRLVAGFLSLRSCTNPSLPVRKVALMKPVVLGLLTLPVTAHPQNVETTFIFDDQLQSGFENWSWASSSLAATSVVRAGSTSAAVDYQAWDGLYFGMQGSIGLPTFGTLEFSVYAQDNLPIAVALVGANGVAGETVIITPTPGQWIDVALSLSDMGISGSASGVWWQNGTDTPRATVYIDEVKIVSGAPPPAVAGPSLAVLPGAQLLTRSVTDPASGVSSDRTVNFPHPISDDVYGMNFAPDALREELGLTVNRWGGNSTERYNHLIGSTNTAHDWFFMSNPEEPGGDHRFEEGNEEDGTKTLLTVPMLGWVSGSREAACSYPVTDRLGAANNAAPQDATQVHWLDGELNCGSGYRDGEFVGAVDPNLTSVAADENFAADWVRELVSRHGLAREGGVEIYALGNEPGLWHSTHGDVRPTPIGREELINTNVSYATAIKAVDPSAEVIGPVLWSGYSYYVTSEELLVSDLRPGDVPTFVGDYLAAMADAEQRQGTRLIDRLAINFYDDRVYNAGTDELRLEATRQLWDPQYAPSDWWVTRDFLYGNGSAVIPRMYELIEQHYPGTKLAITEYNFGGSDTLAGALAQADALGIFGREALDMATVWEPYADWLNMTVEAFSSRPIIHAFRLYRNYDGDGSQFGDRSMLATSSDQGAVSIYAAERSSDGALTVVLINKSTR